MDLKGSRGAGGERYGIGESRGRGVDGPRNPTHQQGRVGVWEWSGIWEGLGRGGGFWKWFLEAILKMIGFLCGVSEVAVFQRLGKEYAGDLEKKE